MRRLDGRLRSLHRVVIFSLHPEGSLEWGIGAKKYRSLYPHLAPRWCFVCLVGDDLPFDTGGDGRTLLSNMAQMGIDPAGGWS